MPATHLLRHNDSGVVPARPRPQDRQVGEVANVEADDATPLGRAVGQLLLIGSSKRPGLDSAQAVMAVLAKGGGEVGMEILVEVKPDEERITAHRRPRPGTG